MNCELILKRYKNWFILSKFNVFINFVLRFKFINDHCFKRNVLELSKLLRWKYFSQFTLLLIKKKWDWNRKVNDSIITKQVNKRRAVTEHDQKKL